MNKPCCQPYYAFNAIPELPDNRQAAAALRSASPSMAAGAAFNGVGFGLGSLAGFTTMVLAGRFLGPTTAGHYFQAVALVSIACSIATCGAEPGAIRALSRAVALGMGSIRRVIAVAVFPVLGVGLLALGVLEAAAPSIARSFAPGHMYGDTLASLRIIAVAIPFWSFERVLTAATRGLGSRLATTLLDGLLQPVLRLLLVVFAVWLSPTLEGFTFAWTLPAIATAAGAMWWLSVVLSRLDTGVGTDRAASPAWSALVRDFWGFAWARGVAYVFQVSTLWLGILLTGWLASSRAAGVFGSLSRVAVVGTLALQSINLVIEPELSKALARRDHRSAQHLYQVATGWAVAVGFPPFILVAVFSPVVLSIFGHGFVGGATALTVVACAMLWNVFTGPVTAVLLMAGRSVWNLWNTATALAVYVVAAVILIPKFGVTGAAVSWSLAIVVENGLPAIEVSRGLGLRAFSSPSLRTAAFALLLFGAGGVLTRTFWRDDVIGAAICAAATLGLYVLYLQRAASPLELDGIVGHISAIRSRGMRGRAQVETTATETRTPR